MIIQCPSCKTKFSVDSNQLRDYATPRFHCSRCDHFFELALHGNGRQPSLLIDTLEREVDPPSLATQVPEALAEPPLPKTLPSADEERASKKPSSEASRGSGLSIRPPKGPRQLDLLPSEEGSTSPLRAEATRNDFCLSSPDTIDVENLMNITVDWPDTIPDRVHEADLGRGQRVPRDLIGQAWFKKRPLVQAHPPAPVAWPSSGVQAIPSIEELPSCDLQTAGESERMRRTSEWSRDTSRSRRGDVTTPNSVFFPPHAVTPSNPSPARVRKSSALLFQLVTFFGPVVFALSIPILVVAGLSWLGNRIEEHRIPLLSNTLGTSSGLGTNVPHGVDLVDLSSEVVTLEDGDQVLQISGNVVNGSPEKLREVSIEAFTFDEGNRELSRIIFPANNGLVTVSKLGALKIDVIELLQTKPGIIGGEIAPNERFPFRAVIRDKVKDAAFFTARVVSVEASAGRGGR